MALLRACLLGLATASMLLLSACVNKEPQERAAFIQLLQARIGSGALTPLAVLSEPEKEAIGDYADAYEVITDFQQAMAKAALPLRDVLAAETIRSVSEIVERRARFEAARKTLAEQAGEIEDARASADKARAAMALPPDLAPVYDGVYDEAVTAPAAELMDAASRMDAVARDALGVADFVAANAADILLADGQARVATPTLQQELNLRLQGLNSQSDGLERARAAVSQAAALAHGEP
ncbi:DUF3053 domain-containing protein [Achromobacter denitrificans]|uniref:DUF3053 family protein n=1 Tax=Achromobacter denitrificans TaxID=32002 RepID=UPI000788465D|nr:DUF3053 family protein [Achromobacter denitrificans]MDX3881594.1 DUF3053 family protein [Achromobacter sp.]ASC68671.1 DUF3053 domain-containing protein [Achromobacter denitrificans]MBV2157554.1 DUF3053 domain-containing protein [Achromobacter denitrificans]MDF3849118.1 DUF3053 family protein [Achromobacter denitrificans]MDF3858812.1 DUF3053 family protein [Achromobacter denitrificans]